MARGLEIKHRREFHPIRTLIWILLVVALVASGWFGYRYFTEGVLPPLVHASALKADPRVDESDVTDKQVDEHIVPSAHPRYISIPKLRIGNTRIFEVGVDKHNILGTPTNINDAAWYRKSATPGAGYGAVLVNAHNGGVTRDGVFAKLGTLANGDEITVERGDGKLFTYRVVENQSMSLDEVNKTGMKMMMQSAEPDKEGLNLITCDGKWVPRIQQFDRRIMLRAVIVEE